MSKKVAIITVVHQTVLFLIKWQYFGVLTSQLVTTEKYFDCPIDVPKEMYKYFRLTPFTSQAYDGE